MSTQRNHALDYFFNDGDLRQWVDPLEGPASTLPDLYTLFKLRGDLRIEFLRNGTNTNKGQGEAEAVANVPNKNHAVFHLPFAQSYTLQSNGMPVKVYGARVSMDLTEDDNALKKIDKDHLESPYIEEAMLHDFYPGTLNIKLLKYRGKTVSANKTVTFPGLDIGSLGAFVDFIKGHKLHEMSFLGYGTSWKGCRDFIAQTYLQLRAQDSVSATDQDGNTLKDTITKVHHRSAGNHGKLIDHGRFLNYVHVYPEDFADAYEEEVIEAVEVEAKEATSDM